jgi:5-methyltetrahydropteroyltriglutamate--homocysteine methyltransferase
MADFGPLAPIREGTGNEANDQAHSHHSDRQPTRPDNLLAISNAKEASETGNRAAFEVSVRSGAAEVVRQRVDAGIDVINDGEMSKRGYATYIKESPKRVRWRKCRTWRSDQASRSSRLFETFRVRYGLFSSGPLANLKMPACDGSISYRDMRDLELDIDCLKAAMIGMKSEEAVMSAASPGLISLFLPDQHYGNQEAYVAALADALKVE